MEFFLGRLVFIMFGIAIGFGFLLVLNRLFNKEIEVNLFNAVNAFLILGLLANIYFGLFEQDDSFVRALSPISIVVISLILFRRFKKYQK